MDIAKNGDEIVQTPSKEKSVSNPFTEAMGITVTLPKTIDIKMVDATVLSDFEVWFTLCSILSTATVAFFVAFLQDFSNASFGYITIVWFILFVVTLIMTIRKRKLLKQKTKTFRLETSKVEEVKCD